MLFSSNATALEEKIGSVFEFEGIEHVCYDSAEHAVIMGAIAEGTKCIELLPTVPVEEAPWFKSKYFIFITSTCAHNQVQVTLQCLTYLGSLLLAVCLSGPH